MKKNIQLIKIHPEDNVKIVVNTDGIKQGTRLEDGIIIKENIPQGHKVALRDFKKGDKIIRYANVIAYAAEDITQGAWINENNVRLPESPKLENLEFGTNIKKYEPLEGYTFEGYKNEDGSVGVKNLLAIFTCVQCVEGVINKAIEKVKNNILRNYPNVDGIVPINHNYGCGVAINSPDAKIPIQTLKNLSQNPNFGDLLVLSLGCEKLEANKLFKNEDKKTIILQKESGFEEMQDTIISAIKSSLKKLNRRKRKEFPLSELVVGVQCGGSDSFSGITANPAVGYAVDLLVQAGASVIFSEVSEVRDGLNLIAPRIKDKKVAKKLKSEIAWYDDYLNSGDVDRDANPTPGNKKGGLVNIVEKSLGSIQKSGTLEIVDVLGPGEKLNNRGLNFGATPASDFICGTLQLAAGINLQVFTTGRGTPYGLAAAPVIKVSSRSELKEKWKDLIDINAGRIINGEVTIEEVGKEIFNYVIEVASGEKITWADKWKIENRLCLFNPAPVT
ncbi:galactarate dehydratase [Halanaerobium salsuginis]|uniref:Galactarate dehydratase n=1 Tax=Halanaerobium salsuginis TaxID=29563 RepID=A0A1I4IIB0_9FIRM|nr:galactarate dehydratase [Halanaerobium salsuginis]SFL53807.1 galactarate dehydratase [Halanaerobium salsuginis]